MPNNQPLDPDEMKVAHELHRASRNGDGCTITMGGGDHCLIYRLAAELTTMREREADAWEKGWDAAYAHLYDCKLGTGVLGGGRDNPFRPALAGEVAAETCVCGQPRCACAEESCSDPWNAHCRTPVEWGVRMSGEDPPTLSYGPHEETARQEVNGAGGRILVRRERSCDQWQPIPASTDHLSDQSVGGQRAQEKPEGLRQKFRVERVDPDAQERHKDCATFVLEPKHDPFARVALAAYARACEADLPALALDLRRWLAAENHLTYGRSVSE